MNVIDAINKRRAYRSLEPVEITNEIVLLKTDVGIKREVEDKTGLKGLFLE